MHRKFSNVRVVRSKVHDYLAIMLDYSKPAKLKVKITDYIKDMIEEFLINLK